MRRLELHTARLVLGPVGWQDMEDMARLKAHAGAFGRMLGGVRSRMEAEREMAQDVAFWGARGFGIFTIREKGVFLGMTGVHDRPDGRGLALRIALFPTASGRGVAREAAGRALAFVLENGADRVIGIAREDNLPSRIVLGSIGMAHVATFMRNATRMFLYERRRHPHVLPLSGPGDRA
ncbi:GNAT family N-acetyltransferase [Oecophyllibacter saccharovorans]|uniref:GNAT family N-acetyltransferase n=1 Tax=Oecophyllibacter saccharovorans TaxID=2558360 RepID=UPI001170A9E0|nr:GNAT family N-acetyltransferase [Oecophyllibacter saccharovorans]TPW36335.1 N-acetyltransferase [Oecophyllibacter saccharovorans]